ncbi:NUDIX hydrolase [Mammaliicoccus stepanovicii]|uniref:NTP pyrophosphohydrolases containing a Zn-finger, probably nucleic-acid-binding n=1 Tax=Mammaliicoccus stepanovicii TaxID=643214 RepID=A0A239ZK75_9STAP|nr:NUDIX hydrolase [Mammaliicoccus stepanovicii]PNZ77944.1 NUDIX hydrolase [Mammaliicoccus stepanovicii]GGI41673.1 NUDIX hydrolase [Mammaliicoccus stepanovicii]SNV71230.1 NTP pyrophosphohydrolases containing a Zn-finger, probably nucleic-acid-binding [Mammaliicoccus stepanovicii]
MEDDKENIIEKWDAYDKDLNKLGYDLIRGEDIEDNVFHLVSEVVIINSDGNYLAMRRDFNKVYPGLYEVSVGGSALRGESPIQAAKRETFEETGIKVSHLKQVGIYIAEQYNTIYVMFLAYVDINKDSIVLQKGETIDYRWVPSSEIKNFLNSEMHVPGKNERVKKMINMLKINYH